VADHRRSLSDSLVNLAVVLEQVGRYRDAEDAFRESLSMEERLTAEDPSNPRHRRGIAYTCASLAGMLAKAGRPQEAEEARRRAVQIMEKLVSEFPNNPECLHSLAYNRFMLGLALRAKKQFLDAQKEFQTAIELNARAVADYPKMTQFRASLARSQFNLARLLRDTGRPQEAEPLYRQALENRMQLVAEAPLHSTELHWAFRNLVDLLQKMDKPQEAETVSRQYLQFYEKLAADFPKEPRYQELLAGAHLNLGRLLRATGRRDEAEQHYRQVLGFYETYPEHKDPQNLRGAALFDLALVLSQSGQTQKAAEIYDQLLKIKPASAVACNNLAWMLATCPEEKLRNPRRAVELAKKAVELDPKSRFVWNTLGAAQYRAGDWQAALQALEKSMELGKGGDAFDWFFLAMAHWQLGEKGKAREFYDRAVQWMDKNQPTNEELRRFHAEAAALLELSQKK
jgi:tetratricopeptide (TPR) repeat protein